MKYNPSAMTALRACLVGGLVLTGTGLSSLAGSYAQIPAEAPAETSTETPVPTETLVSGEGGRNAHLTVADLAVVNEASAWFNQVHTLKGAFDQQNQDGSLVGGDFYLRRPGRMRFEYAEPQKLTLLADGLWVVLDDRELESLDRYPLRDTALWLILKKDVDLAKDAEILRVERQGDLVAITAREDEGGAQGDLTLVFAGPQLELRHWVIEDVQGNRTLVSLRNMQSGMRLAPELFVAEEYDMGIRED